jgi:hypothetical protein
VSPSVGLVGAAEAGLAMLSAALAERGVHAVAGVLLDLGVSSPQLDRAERGAVGRAPRQSGRRRAHHEQRDASRERVASFLARDDVRAELQAQGVSADDAIARVKAMSDAEVAQLAQRVDQAPAGAGVIGVLFTVFVILLVTDILGFTKVFPFTRAIR